MKYALYSTAKQFMSLTHQRMIDSAVVTIRPSDNCPLISESTSPLSKGYFDLKVHMQVYSA